MKMKLLSSKRLLLSSSSSTSSSRRGLQTQTFRRPTNNPIRATATTTSSTVKHYSSLTASNDQIQAQPLKRRISAFNSKKHLINVKNFSCYSQVFKNFGRTPDGRLIKPFLLADIGEGITGCEIVEWLVKPGQKVAEFDPVAEVQSDKASVEITSPFEGTIESLLGKVGEVIKVGDPLCMIIVEEEEPESVVEEEALTSPTNDQIQDQLIERDEIVSLAPDDVVISHFNNHEIHSTPAVRRLAKENQIDLKKVNPTGKNGRITKEDILNYLKLSSKTDQSQRSTISDVGDIMDRTGLLNERNLSTATKAPAIKKVSLGPVKMAMFRAMSNSLKIPHFGYYEEIDITELERLRQKLSSSRSKDLRNDGEQVKITLLSLFVKIMGRSMIENDLFRSTLSFENSNDLKNSPVPQLIERSSCDISIAVSSRFGLLTPVIPSVESKSVLEISRHISKIRNFIDHEWKDDEKVPRFPDELGGNRSGTMTLSNIGIIGATYTHPLIPPTGQLAIAGIGSTKVVPGYDPRNYKSLRKIAVGGDLGRESLDKDHRRNEELMRVSPRLKVNFSFTGDHRIVEGIEMGRLVSRFKQICEEPEILIERLV